MNVHELSKELALLPPETKVDAWLKARSIKQIKTLELADAGKGIRAIVELLGKPYTHTVSDLMGKPLPYRKVLWAVTTEQAVVVAEKLKELAIEDFRIDDKWLLLQIEKTVLPRIFYSSSNIEEWKAEREKHKIYREQFKKRLEVKRAKQEEARKLAQAEANAAWAAGAALREEQVRILRERKEKDERDLANYRAMQERIRQAQEKEPAQRKRQINLGDDNVHDTGKS